MKFRVTYHDDSRFMFGSAIDTYDTLEEAKKAVDDLLIKYPMTRHSSISIESFNILYYKTQDGQGNIDEI